MTDKGIQVMKEKFWQGDFGCCPRTKWRRQYVLPIGLTDQLSNSRVKIYCPKCEDVYIPRNGPIELDGAFFGRYFPEAFLQSYPDFEKESLGKEDYNPTIYGFKIFGKKGSLYEYKKDGKGRIINKQMIDMVRDTIVMEEDLEDINNKINGNNSKNNYWKMKAYVPDDQNLRRKSLSIPNPEEINAN